MRLWAWEIAVFLVAAALFRFFPGIDLWFSRLFYRPGEGFFLAENPAVLFIYHSVHYLLAASLAAAAAIYSLNRWQGWRKVTVTGPALAYLVLTLLVGPAFLVEGVLKGHWGRPRPHSVEEFGGTKHFQPAFVISSECEKNCSFVSGHASVGFYFASFGLLPGTVNPLLVAVGLAAGIIVGLGRVIQGGHFLSDVVFAGFFVCFTAQALRVLFSRAMLSRETR